MHTSLSSQSGAVADDVPSEVRRWNWAAFFLHVFWGVAHRCYISLLFFVPFVGLAVPFILGAKGNAWAWQKGQWNSSAQFLAAQRRWLRYAVFAYSGAALLSVGIVWSFSQGMQRSEPFQLALSQLEHNAEVAQVLGLPLDTGWVRGSIELGSSSGTADITFPVTGPKASGRAYVYAKKHANVWAIDRLAVDIDGGGRIALASAIPSNAAAATTTSVMAASSATRGRINDYASVLRPDEVAALQAQLEAHQSATGQAFGVTIMPTLAGTSSDTVADQLTKSWAAGRAGADNGLLVLLAIAERRAQVRVSPKLSSAFADGFVSTLIHEQLDPAFQSGQYGRALATTFDALARRQQRR